MFIIVSLLLAAIGVGAVPTLYATQNWGACRIPPLAPGDPCESYQSAWRLVTVDTRTGAITDLTGWKNNKFSEANAPRADGTILGVGYSLDGSELRDQLTMQVGTDGENLSIWDLTKEKFSLAPVASTGATFDENSGFFISVSADDVLPATKISLYDSMNLRFPSHFATIDTTPCIQPRIRMALDTGNSEATQHIYVAASGFSAPQLYEVARESGNVTTLALDLEGVENAEIEAMLVNPLTAGAHSNSPSGQ